MLNLTRLHLGIAHESQFQGLGITAQYAPPATILHAQDDSNCHYPWPGLDRLHIWPIYDLLVLLRAMETRDVHTVTQHVYFDPVRVSLTNQVVAAYSPTFGAPESASVRSRKVWPVPWGSPIQS